MRISRSFAIARTRRIASFLRPRNWFKGLKASVLEPAEEDDPLDPGASLVQQVRHSMIWKDTASSARRFFIALLLLVPAMLIGLHMAVFPYAGAFFLRFVLFFDKIVALSLLPILFIVFGIDEWSKIMLMVIGVAPNADARRIQHRGRRTQRTDCKSLHAQVDQPRCGLPSGSQAGAAAVDQQRAAQPEAAGAVSVCGRDDRLDRRAGLSHRHHAPAHGDGHHHPLPALGGSAAVFAGRTASLYQQETAPVVSAALRSVEDRSLNPLMACSQPPHSATRRTEIELRDVSLSYPAGKEGSKTVLSRLNLKVAAGEFVVILGETGCGKSTLLRLILGQEFPTAGAIEVDGKPVTSIDARCGYVPQKYSLFPDRTVLGNVMYGPENAKGRFLARLRPSFFAYRRKLRTEAQAIPGAHGFASAGHEQVSAPALGRYAAARGHCAGAVDASAGAAAGRGVQRARSVNQGQPAGAVADASGWSRNQRWFL